jgi:hypothetical protein
VRGKTETWAISKPKVGFDVISININRMILTESDLNSFGNCLSLVVICKKKNQFYVPTFRFRFLFLYQNGLMVFDLDMHNIHHVLIGM